MITSLIRTGNEAAPLDAMSSPFDFFCKESLPKHEETEPVAQHAAIIITEG